MKDKLIFRKNMLLITIVCFVVAVVEIATLLYLTYTFIEEEKRFAMKIVLCMFIPVIPGLLFLLFNRYLRANAETVTQCSLFKRKQVISWKDATVTKTNQNFNGAVLPTAIISDGTQEIRFHAISDKDFAFLEQLCKTAREQSNPDNLTF